MPKGKVIVRPAQKRASPGSPVAPGQSHGESKSRRRRIYLKERLPAVLAEMKSVMDEKKELMGKRKTAGPEDRKESNRRLNYLVERLDVLRDERSALLKESRGYARPTNQEE